MRSALSSLKLERPRSLAAALGALHQSVANERLIPLAGGTDLYVYLNAGTLAGRRFLDLTPLAEIGGIRPRRDGVTIGALATFREIRTHPVLRRRFPTLAAAAAEVGGWQIQSRATLAGNVANASPAGDSLPVLLALDAVVRVQSVRGARAIPFDRLYRGYRQLDLAPIDDIRSDREYRMTVAGNLIEQFLRAARSA